MSKFVINGGKTLEGSVKISGSKNAALPLIAASVLLKETKLSNVPKINDVEMMLEIVSYLGGEYKWLGENELLINTENLKSKPLPDSARKLRASILFAGPMLARFGEAVLPYPGGDIIGARPLDTHLNAFKELGVDVTEKENLYLKVNKLNSASASWRIVLQEPSVTATENVLMLAAGMDNHSVEIRLAAAEPHVQDLCQMLVSAGVEIIGIGTTALKIKGKKVFLNNVQHQVISDDLEISAFAVLAAATKSQIKLLPIQFEYLDSVLMQLERMNVNFEKDTNSLTILPPTSPYKSFRIQSGLYPKLICDHLPPFAVLATQAEGASLVHEWMYEARQSYLRELMKMGANAVIMDPHRALIIGPSSLFGKEVTGFDIRSGMTMVIAALVAKGQTIINGVEHIDRGYENLEGRLKAVGADINRI
ncbi:MAG: UDP-N-acetylglucosamine 1-carboxyvinyltransferase [bacterium]|nr:UDP-N-acetylglucosamine 1-carboxyvinyltransferase [bacterium]